MAKYATLPPVTMMTAVDPKGNPIGGPEIEGFRLRLMGLFGIDKPAEIAAFMKTPAGIEAVNIVAEEIMLQESYEKQHEQDLRDARIRRNRALAALLLALLYKKADAKDRIQRSYEEYEKIIEKGNEAAIKEAQQFSSQTESMYQSAHKALDDYLDKLNTEAEALEKQQENLLQEKVALEEKYQVIDNQVNKGLALIQDDNIDTDPEAKTKKIKGAIFKLDNKIEALSDEIAEMAEKNEDITEKLHKLNGYALRREMLEAFLNKNFYTLDGELIKPEEKQARYHEAAFFLKPEQKLVKHDGQLMILRHDQDPNSLGLEKRAQAAKTFDAHKDQYSEVSKLCARSKAAEQLSLSTRAQKLAERCDSLNNRMMLLTSQISALEEGRTQVNQLKQTQQTKPTATMNSGNPAPRPNPVKTTQSYRHMLQLMGGNTPDPSKLMTIATGLSNNKSTDKQIKELLLQRLEQSGIIDHSDKDSLHRQLRSGGQIQPQTLRELQERINQRPSTVNQIQKQHEPLTPFSMTPTPKHSK